CLQGYTIPLTF
nr:immunoglobulin light chain junction region [Macaca mulatta]MOX25333.1 immunoglobulin light chain junction region [Macaca mulatta]